MSRIGKKPIEIKEGVKVEVDKNRVIVSGSKGSSEFVFRPEVAVEVSDGVVNVSKKGKYSAASALWGTTARIIENMIQGVSEGFEKKLELNGVGFRMEIQGKKINLALGFSHPVIVDIPEGLEVKIEKNIMSISGIDKQRVGQFSAEVRALKPVEPYKGKGFKYDDEIVRRKEGKKAASGE